MKVLYSHPNRTFKKTEKKVLLLALNRTVEPYWGTRYTGLTVLYKPANRNLKRAEFEFLLAARYTAAKAYWDVPYRELSVVYRLSIGLSKGQDLKFY